MARRSLLVLAVVLALAAVALAAVGLTRESRDDEPWGYAMGSMMGGRASDEATYLTEMIAHHEDAVTAARELARSDRPELRALGESIVTTQTAQIEQMRTWLARWYPDAASTVDYQPMMRDLSGLGGDELDRAFLEDMISHHMVAVMMSQQLLAHGTEHDEVAKLARSIRDDQHAEVIQMQRWLGQWFGVGAGMMSRVWTS